MADVDYVRELALAVECAKEAGDIVKRAWTSKTEIHFKAATDLVTETDKQCEQLIMNKIQKEFPTHKFIAEEDVSEGKGEEKLTDDPTWIIDPLDGTTNFVHRFPFVAISIGFAIHKKVVVGVIYNPILEEMFQGSYGHGAFLNGQPIHVSERYELKHSLIALACGAEISKEDTDLFLHHMNVAITNCRSWRRAGSAALDMAYIACGRTDIYCEKGIHAWDIAAGIIIVVEAGGIVRAINGDTLDICSRQVLCGNKTIIPKFLEAKKI